MKAKSVSNLWCVISMCLLVSSCLAPRGPVVAENSALIDQELAGLLSKYERAWRNYKMSGGEGTARAEYKAHQELLKYVLAHCKEEALKTYVLCAPDGPHSDDFRAEILRQYLKLTPADHVEFCREVLANRLFDKTYQHAFRVRAAVYLAERKERAFLEFALHLLESNPQYAENDGILIVGSYYGWKGSDHIPSDHWDLPDPWMDMKNSELAKDIAVYLREQLEVVPKYAPGAEQESPNKADAGDG